MELGTRDATLIAGSTAALVLGVALIIFTNGPSALIGIALIVLSAVLFIPFARDLVVKEDEAEREQVTRDEVEREH